MLDRAFSLAAARMESMRAVEYSSFPDDSMSILRIVCVYQDDCFYDKLVYNDKSVKLVRSLIITC